MTTVRVPKGVVVKSLLRGGVVALAGAAAALLVGTAWGAGAATQPRIVKFSGSYAGLATVKITDNVADIAASGAGTGTLLGASKVTGKGLGDASQQPCVPFAGPGSLFNTKGTKILFKVLPGSQGCGDEEGNVFSVSGRAQVLGGTKVYRKAKGALKLTGVYDRGAGTFKVKLTGKITVP